MTTTQQRANLGTWVGLGVGLALAWGGWELWQSWQRAHGDYDVELASPPAIVTPPWYECWWWTDYLVTTALVVLALLCAVAGAMIGRSGTRRSTKPTRMATAVR